MVFFRWGNSGMVPYVTTQPFPFVSLPICTEFTDFFWTFSIVRYSKKHDVSETGSVSVLRWRWGRRQPTQVGHLERANLNHWTRKILCCTTYTIVRILSSLPFLFVIYYLPVNESWAGQPGFDSRQGQEIYYTPQRPHWLLGPRSLL
jgi:hypothetical protein